MPLPIIHLHVAVASPAVSASACLYLHQFLICNFIWPKGKLSVVWEGWVQRGRKRSSRVEWRFCLGDVAAATGYREQVQNEHAFSGTAQTLLTWHSWNVLICFEAVACPSGTPPYIQWLRPLTHTNHCTQKIHKRFVFIIQYILLLKCHETFRVY